MSSAALLRCHLWYSNWKAAHEEALESQVCREAMERYVEMRMAGESRKLVVMLAKQQAPALRTDSEFRKGHVNGNQFESCAYVGDAYRRMAQHAGVDTSGKIYLRGLARYPGDPAAWVHGRGDVQRIAEDRGWGVSGAVNVARREVEPMPDIQIGRDIVDQAAASMRAANPGLSLEEARHQAAQLRAGAGGDGQLKVSWPEGEGAEESREIM